MSKDNKIADTFEVSPAAGYAGDVTPAVAWKILGELKDAILIDVRTRAEWNYVGVPDLAGLDKKPGLVEWQVLPSMQVNPDFVGALSEALADKAVPLLFLCRSGAKRRSAQTLPTGLIQIGLPRVSSQPRTCSGVSGACRCPFVCVNHRRLSEKHQ